MNAVGVGEEERLRRLEHLACRPTVEVALRIEVLRRRYAEQPARRHRRFGQANRQRLRQQRSG
ncbi:hypothetical protein Pma05_59930 [Plantactinospora mayteni]|uniref:Transposase n=1 Tax=Plantactinospora mayteni TaxID=566021 RepID=A0ABQ4EXQ1_9ACTN|nr:hypothetical protein Pma05_59930 [Plantactinospora mayteni]